MRRARGRRIAALVSSARKVCARSRTRARPASLPRTEGPMPRRVGMLPMTAVDTVKDLHAQVKRCPACGSGFGVEATFCPIDGTALKVGTWDKALDRLTDTVID